MVNFIIGRSGSGKSVRVTDMIVREITHGTRQVVLIVPEQQTVMWETKMARLLHPSANFRLEITNFTRLANSVFREYGGLADTVVDDGTRPLLVWRAMVSVWDQLTVYNHCANGREDRNIPHLLSAIDELKNSGITPEMAEKALDQLLKDQLLKEESDGETDEINGENDHIRSSSGDLTSRLSDAVLVYSAYNALLHEEYIDRGDLLHNLAETLAKHPYFGGKAVYIDSFFSLTKAEERILGHIIRQAEDVTLTFTCPTQKTAENGNARCGENDASDEELAQNTMEEDARNGKETTQADEIQFREIKRYMREAAAIANRCGKEICRIELSENLRHKDTPELALIERYLFDYVSEMKEISDIENSDCAENKHESSERAEKWAENVQIIGCADIYDEAEACASIVDKLLREGYKNSEIAIVARDMKTREGVIDSVLRRHNVRYFLSESTDVASLPAVRFVLSALQVAANGWQRTDVIKLLKTGFTLVGKEIDGIETVGGEVESEIDEQIEIEENGKRIGINTALEGDVFEIYTETWNIRGRKMFTGENWSMNPAGYKTERGETEEEMLRLANSAKEKLVVPLDRMLSVFDIGSADVREIAERIVYYAEDCRLAESLEALADSYMELGLPAEAEITLQSWDKVCEILDKMVETLGETKLDAGRFAGLFAKVASSMDVGTIPTGVDEIVLGSSSGVRFDEVKCVIIVGAKDGEFPGVVADSGNFFGERDKIALEAVGLNIGSPNMEEQTAREYFMFYRTVVAAKEKLYILCPSAETEALSEGAERVGQILDGARLNCTKKFAEICAEDVIYNKSTADYLLNRRVSSEEIELIRNVAASGSADREAIRLTNLTEQVENAQIEVFGIVQNDELSYYDDKIASGKKNYLTLSQSKIETFVSCPFKYWCEYQMKMGSSPVAEIKAPDIGTFMHAILEQFFGGLTVEQMENMPLDDSETESIADEIIAKYIETLSRNGLGIVQKDGSIVIDGRLQYLFLRLRRHVLVFLKAIMREFAQSKFRPVAYEMPIGIEGRDGISSIEIETKSGVNIKLQGIADRIDIYEDEENRKFVRVVDYKTGSKTFSLDDVKRGLNVQLLIYLFSVQKNGLPKMNNYAEFLPAGAVYFQAKPTSVSSGEVPEAADAVELVIDKIERTGVLLDDEDVLRAMEKDLAGKYIKTKTDSNGGIKSSQKSTSLLSLEEFGKLEAELEDVIGRIGDQLLSGKADAKPTRIGGRYPCEWCDKRYVCRNVQY